MKLILAVLATALLSSGVTAQENKFAPLPERVTSAKSVAIVNDTAISRFGDGLYEEVHRWNHWQVVAEKSKADVILVLSQRDTVNGVISTANVQVGTNSASSTAVTAPITASA